MMRIKNADDPPPTIDFCAVSGSAGAEIGDACARVPLLHAHASRGRDGGPVRARERPECANVSRRRDADVRPRDCETKKTSPC